MRTTITKAITMTMVITMMVITIVLGIWADVKAATNNALRQTMQTLKQFTWLTSV